ncbi:hypothetical protein [Dendronalium sp. ChiSLP03b]|uniref:hypothetical protein n=1 Tax=Dendronalium sp. ChiSLP03b TaxID=3075381 RepID=UPI002AD21AAF|nr:hypothetical protein [Dendronalium sp. ChiSLP03b]MDZ8205824.1 hypothetical protein [Dendronalium sp. ChiSLP03b]
MSIKNINLSVFFVKKLIIVLACLVITGTSFASESSKCQVVGNLFWRKNVWQENQFNSLPIDIIRSPKIINRVLQELNSNSIHSQSISSQDLINNLKIETIANTDVLKISYSHSNLNLAAKVVNSVMNHYLEEDLLQFQQQAAVSKKVIENNLAIKIKEIRIAEQVLQKLCESRHTNQEEISQYQNNLKNLNTEYENLLIRLQEISVAEKQSRGNARIISLASSDCNK